MKYFDELERAMSWLGEKEDTYFLGQAVGCPGTAMFNTLKNVSMTKRLELPVFEETQMGITVGMAVNNTVPISIFPRWDFLICATSQLVNHLNRLKKNSNGEYVPKAIIRTGVGSQIPLHPHFQHMNDYTEAFKLMCDNIEIIKLNTPEEIFPAYQKAYERGDGKSTILVEVSDYLNSK